ncbi:MAG: hypothetical protein FRX48_09445 [Lasallia pustulata]|uniref:HNH nuclease domain-containing protein n=1 Tax=Lasallia pustulata TaxID=136370 RepID=A0A5M8PD77_9LECA|nr:MAG: hypothetical protein FRX48_09445 [Lasallia pustulata]
MEIKQPSSIIPTYSKSIPQSGFPTKIVFRHPAYDDDTNVLLRLQPFDHPQGGLHLHVGLVACQIIANNAFNGYITKTKGGSPIATGDFHSVLLEKEYYFYVPSPPSSSPSASPYQYPIIPSFRHWRFPHSKLPAIWQTLTRETAQGPISAPSNIAASICARDGPYCRLTGYGDALDTSHVVPDAEWEWFAWNNMMQYNCDQQLSSGVVNDTRNFISLRTDVHRIFDERGLMFVPKPVPSVETDTALRESPSIDLVAHFLVPTATLQLLYHNAIIHPISNICPEFFFARFAWSIFPFLSEFLMSQRPRQLITHIISDSGIPEVKEKLFSGKECVELAPGRSNRRSPTKRSRTQDMDTNGEDWTILGSGTQENPSKALAADTSPSSKRQRFDSQTSSLTSSSHTHSHSPNRSSRHISPDNLKWELKFDPEQEMRGRTRQRYF